MNKKILFVLSLLLVSCNNETPNSETISSISESVSSEVISSEISSSEDVSSEISSSSELSSSSEEVDEYNVLPNWQDEQYSISIGDDLLDVAVGRAFMSGAEYNCTYSMGKELPSVASDERIVLSNEKVCSIERTTSKSFIVKALHAGKTKIRIYDSNNIIRYCDTITVEDKIALEDMEEYLVYDAEYWVSAASWGDYYSITFLEGGRYILSGYFSNVPFETVTGTYKYVEDSITGKEYTYEFTDDDVKATGFTGFDISMTGTFMYLQEDGGTAAIMLPNDKVDEFND